MSEPSLMPSGTGGPRGKDVKQSVEASFLDPLVSSRFKNPQMTCDTI